MQPVESPGKSIDAHTNLFSQEVKLPVQNLHVLDLHIHPRASVITGLDYSPGLVDSTFNALKAFLCTVVISNCNNLQE